MKFQRLKNAASITPQTSKWHRLPRLLAFFALLAFFSLSRSAMAQQHTIYLGTYTGHLSQGIYRCTLDGMTGQLSTPELVVEAKNPTFLAMSPNARTLYSVLESEGKVGAWTIGDDQKLTLLNTQSSGGSGPCHVWVDATGKTVFVANYGGGSISAYPVKDDGSLGESSAFFQHVGTGPNKGRQEKAHAHSIYTDPTNTFVYTCDLGTDEVKIYRFDATKSTLTPNEPTSGRGPAGGGPRHLAFGPNDFIYVNNELTLSVTAFKRDVTTGALTEIQTIPTMPADAPAKSVSTAEIFVHPNGKWLYVSNRGRDTITQFNIGDDGKLTWVEEIATPVEPRGFAISPDGRWLVAGGQKNNKLVSYSIDTETGHLKSTTQDVSLGAPVSIQFGPLPKPVKQ